MDQRYGNSVHMTTFPMQHQQNTGQQGYPSSHHYQQFYQDYPDGCYPSPAYHEVGYPGDQYGYHPTASVPYGTGIESYLDPKYAANPAAFASRLPYLPFHTAAAAAYGMYDYSFEPAFIRKRNERERQRVKCVNEGYARLREHLPEEYAEKRLSKVETLRGAILYIRQLQNLLGFDPEKQTKEKKINNKGKSSEVDEIMDDGSEKNQISVGGIVSKKLNLSSSNDEVNPSVLSNAKSNHKETNELNTSMKLIPSCDFDNHSNSDSQKEKGRKKQENFSFASNTQQDINTIRDFKYCLRDSPCSEFSSCASSSCRLEPPRTQKVKHPQNNDRYQDNSKRLSHCYFGDSMNEIKSNGSRGNLYKIPGLKGSLDQTLGSTHERLCIETANSCQTVDNTCSETVQKNTNDSVVSARLWDCTSAKQNLKEDFGKNCGEYYHHQPSFTEEETRRKSLHQNSRYFPYSRADSAFGTHQSGERWDGLVQVKTEIHTPPPCIGYEDFNYDNSQLYAFQNEVILRNRFHGNSTTQRQLEYMTQNGGQSDGFKSDTSPESTLGGSP